MKLVHASAKVMLDLDKMSIEERIELCGRVCYKSEDKISEGSAKKFIGNVIKRGHSSVLEMAVISFKVTCLSIEDVNKLFQLQLKYFQITLEPACSEPYYTLLITASVRAYREALISNSGASRILDIIGSYLRLHYKNIGLFDYLKGETFFSDYAGLSVVKLSVVEIDSLPIRVRAKHRFVAVRFICDRTTSHQIVRHRPASYLQESQRYCRYSDGKFDGHVEFIIPVEYYADNRGAVNKESIEFTRFFNNCRASEDSYMNDIMYDDAAPQRARKMLNGSTKTELIMFANLEEWQHVIALRTSSAADPSIRPLMRSVYEQLVEAGMI